MHLTGFLVDGPSNEELEGVGMTGGIMRFEFSKKHRQLWLVTEYEAQRTLDDHELQILIDFIVGQWLDGAGEDWGPELQGQNGGIAPLCHPEDLHAWQES